jgi:hypothetical protein
MPLNEPCDCCEQLFKDPATVKLVMAEGYIWTRILTEVLSSAAHGCSFCQLVSRTFDLAKLANSRNSKSVRPHGQLIEAFTEKPITFKLEGFPSFMEINALGWLTITAQDVDGNEENLQHWGLSGALSFRPKVETFQVMAPEGMCTEMGILVALLICHTIGDAATGMIRNNLSLFAYNFETRIIKSVAWMKKCEEDDEVCKKLGNGPLPTRIIDLGTMNHESQLKLRDDLAGASGRYACLSYCWGLAQPIMTQSDTIDDFKNGINLTSLPKTIRDAIFVTRKLNLRYLWVDALCILQDNEEDKARECSKMDQIYQQAYVTIAAARAEGCQDGFLDGTESIADSLPRLPISCPDGREGSIIILPREKDMFEDPLLSRAWALQEHVLSSRVLIWSKYQLFWLCTAGLRHEQVEHPKLAGPYYKRTELFGATSSRKHDDEPDTPCLTEVHQALAGKAPITNGHFDFQFAPDFVHEEMQALWEQLMEEYSRRKLSVMSDKLSALAGLASRFREFIQDDYLAGHWRRWLLPHLLWRCVDEEGAVRLPCCPSWSWLSVDGPICIENLRSSNLKIFQPQPVATIIDCKTALRFETAPYDQVTSGEVTIHGYLSAVALDVESREFRYNHPYNRQQPEEEIRKITLDDPTAFWAMKEQSGTSSLIKIWCLPLYTVLQANAIAMVRGIALVKSSRMHYKRVGWFYGDADWCYRARSKGVHEKDVKII